MKQPQPATKGDGWRNLRDAEGVLYGRVDRTRLLLEIRNHGKTATFDLREYLQTIHLDEKPLK